MPVSQPPTKGGHHATNGFGSDIHDHAPSPHALSLGTSSSFQAASTSLPAALPSRTPSAASDMVYGATSSVSAVADSFLVAHISQSANAKSGNPPWIGSEPKGVAFDGFGGPEGEALQQQAHWGQQSRDSHVAATWQAPQMASVPPTAPAVGDAGTDDEEIDDLMSMLMS